MTIDTVGDWVVWDNREPVTLTSVATAGDTEQDVLEALRRPLTNREIAASYGVYTARDVRWLLPVELVDGSIKPRDRITDEDDVVWTVLEVLPKAALGCFWRTICRALAIVEELKDLITVEVPTIGQSATGAITRTWTVKYSAIAGRAQPQEETDFDERGKQATRTTYRIYVGQQIDPRNSAGDWGRVKVNGGAAMNITSYQDPERITDLPFMEATLDP